MKLSIIIPIFNVENYLEECLNSIINQEKVDLNDIETILVDDGSTDFSGKIAKKYAANYPNLFFYHKKINGGLSDARNFGINIAKGDFLLFLDSDDKLSLDICNQIFYVIENNSIDLIVYNYARFNEKNFFDKQIENINTGYIEKKEYLLLPPAAWNKVIRRKIMIQHSLEFPFGLWYEDRGLTGAYVNYINEIYFLDEIGYYYRFRENSITNRNSFNEKMLDIFPIMELLYDQLKDSIFRDELEYIFIDNLISSFALTLLPYGKKREVIKAIDTVNDKFPNWRDNKYLKSRSFKYKLLCSLLYRKRLKIVSFILRRLSI